jgi:hypothetical protein
VPMMVLVLMRCQHLNNLPVAGWQSKPIMPSAQVESTSYAWNDTFWEGRSWKVGEGELGETPKGMEVVTRQSRIHYDIA